MATLPCCHYQKVALEIEKEGQMSRKGIVEIEVICGLDAEDCKPWNELTPKQQEEQYGTDPFCGGTGGFGAGCVGCHFCLGWEIMDAHEEATDESQSR